MIELPHSWVERSWRHGKLIVERYAAGFNRGSRSLSSHGAERSAEVQAHGRMAECAFCLFVGLDPGAALNWSGYSDCGFDLAWAGARIDVKRTGRRGHCLIWPVNKRHIFEREPFSVLALVRGDCPRFMIAGFISKRTFWRCKREADGSNGLDRGTWFMHEGELADPELFRAAGTLLNLRVSQRRKA